LRILVTALGGYFGSRLMQNIREDKGYTYGINAMLVGRRSGAKIVITSECDTAYTYLLVREVENEIRRIQDKLMSEEELDTVKNNMLSDLAKTLDSPFSMASCVSSNIIFSTGEDYFNRQIAEITKITTKELQEVANKYLDVSKFYTAIAGDEKQLKLYGK
jgi:predicted Zn-dependent peptidase